MHIFQILDSSILLQFLKVIIIWILRDDKWLYLLICQVVIVQFVSEVLNLFKSD